MRRSDRQARIAETDRQRQLARAADRMERAAEREIANNVADGEVVAGN